MFAVSFWEVEGGTLQVQNRAKQGTSDGPMAELKKNNEFVCTGVASDLMEFEHASSPSPVCPLFSFCWTSVVCFPALSWGSKKEQENRPQKFNRMISSILNICTYPFKPSAWRKSPLALAPDSPAFAARYLVHFPGKPPGVTAPPEAAWGDGKAEQAGCCRHCADEVERASRYRVVRSGMHANACGVLGTCR